MAENVKTGWLHDSNGNRISPSTLINQVYTVDGEVWASGLSEVAKSGSYNDLSDKPTIPSAVTESTVSGWGFTKNTGTYSKPSTGIPKTDLSSSIQTSLGKADTALQEHQDISGKANTADLATVASTGSYNDLENLPDISDFTDDDWGLIMRE